MSIILIKLIISSISHMNTLNNHLSFKSRKTKIIGNISGMLYTQRIRCFHSWRNCLMPPPLILLSCIIIIPETHKNQPNKPSDHEICSDSLVPGKLDIVIACGRQKSSMKVLIPRNIEYSQSDDHNKK